MLFLLDTNAISDLMSGHAKLGARLAAAAASDRVATCPIALGEIRYGIERLPEGRRKHELAAKWATLHPLLVCDPVPAAAADYYARTKSACQARGLALDENDLWIAATALALGAVLVTRDADFQAVSQLVVEDWTV